GGETERQLETIAAGGGITALLGIQLGETVGDVVPMRNRRIRPVHADAIQRVLAAERVGKRGAVVSRLLPGIQRRQRRIDRVPAGGVGVIVVVLHAGLLVGK